MNFSSLRSLFFSNKEIQWCWLKSELASTVNV